MDTAESDRAARSAEATAELLDELEAAYRDPSFKALLDELWRLRPGEERQRFVRDILCQPQALRERGVDLPPNLTIQRTYFEDDRPTLFALVAHFPPGYPFVKATVTFDDSDSVKPEE